MSGLILLWALGSTICFAALYYGTGRRAYGEVAFMAVFSALVWWLLLPMLAYAWAHEKLNYDSAGGAARDE